MMTGSKALRPASIEGNDTRHIPVLLAEVLAALDVSDDERVIDGTFGAGGYTRALLERTSSCHVLAIDRDPDAIAAGRAMEQAFADRFTLVHGRFGDLDALAEAHDFAPVDAVVLDIGVSSMQIDDPARGFSFRADGPLDMRMAQEGETAADLVNTMEEAALADLIYLYGEERKSRAVARAIITARRTAPIETTKQLADLVATVVHLPPDAIHPATRTFQALRIAVNDELGELERGLVAAEKVLKPGGRLAVVTFHSLEDRIVKHFIAERAGELPSPSRHMPSAEKKAKTFASLARKAITAGLEETRANPRARSAKLRIAERTGEAPMQYSHRRRA
jgi:16S rRNA (cytosine1402-N4)-methyltransferase